MSSQTVTVKLESNIVLVTGTVNGEAATWTRAGDAWQAIVPATEDGAYKVNITATNSLGVAANFNFVLYYGLSLITDRTQEDVDIVAALYEKPLSSWTDEEKAAFCNGEYQGSYDYTDLNRVGAALKYVANRLNDCGYDNLTVTAKSDWKESDTQTVETLAYYLEDVKIIRSALTVWRSTPSVPDDLQQLTYIEANNIEQILLDVNTIITIIMQSYRYAGEVYGGEV